jgi:hypothetical protein
VKKQLEKELSCFCIGALDGLISHWNYFALWIDSNTKLQTALLDFWRDRDTIFDYSIPKEGVVGTVGDNTTSMVVTPKEIQEDYNSEALPHECFAHLFHPNENSTNH